MGTGSWLDASSDLERALKMAKEIDPSQAVPIRDKLQEVKDRISALRASGQLPPAGASTAVAAATAASSADDGDGVVEEVKEAPAAPATSTASRAAASTGASTSSSSSSSSVGAGPMAGMDMEKMQEMVSKNPEMIKQVGIGPALRRVKGNPVRGWRQLGNG